MKKQIGFDKSDLFVLLYLALLFFVWCWAISGYPSGLTLDDGWIHLSFARNLVFFHVWSINPSQGSSGGASSILWVLMLAVGYLFTSNGIWVSYFYNFILFVVLAFLLRRYIEEMFPSLRKGKIISACIFVISTGNLIWFAFSGMETLAFLVFGLASFYFAFHKKYGFSGMFLFLTSLVRPEGIIVAFIVALLLRKKVKQAFMCFLIGLSGLVLTFIWNYHLTGTVFPSTLIGRRWIIGAPMSAETNVLKSVGNFLRIVGVWGYRLLEFSFGKALLTKIGLPDLLAWALSGLCGFVCFVGFWRYLNKMRFATRGLFVWGVLSILAYSIMMPTRGHAGRYQPMIIVLAMLCFLSGMEYFWRVRVKGFKVGKIVVIASVFLSLSSVYVWCRITQMSLLHFDRVHISAAKWIAKNTSVDAKISAFDIGALAYFGNREIIDLGGLIDPSAGRAMYEGEIVRYIYDNKADYLVMIFPYTQPDVYMRELGIDEMRKKAQLRFVKQFHIDIDEPYWPGEAERLLTNTIRIYRIEYVLDEQDVKSGR